MHVPIFPPRPSPPSLRPQHDQDHKTTLVVCAVSGLRRKMKTRSKRSTRVGDDGVVHYDCESNSDSVSMTSADDGNDDDDDESEYIISNNMQYTDADVPPAVGYISEGDSVEHDYDTDYDCEEIDTDDECGIE